MLGRQNSEGPRCFIENNFRAGASRGPGGWKVHRAGGYSLYFARPWSSDLKLLDVLPRKGSFIFGATAGTVCLRVGVGAGGDEIGV